MNPFIKRMAALLCAGCLTLCCAAALADISAEADRTTVQPGDTVTVTLSVTGENLSVAEGTFAYDSALLSFTESDGGAADGFFTLYSAAQDGASTLRARIVFTALAAGEATVLFTLENLLDYKGHALDTGSASVAVVIAAAPATPSPVPVDYSDAALSVAAQNVRGATADLYVWRSIDNVTLPSRYTETDVSYHGQTVKGAAVAHSDAPTLLYLSDASGNSAGFYIYDAAGDALYPYRTVSSVSKTYILLSPDGSVAMPEGFMETTLTVGANDVQAWSMADAQGTVYLVYARNPDGEVGFYFYNPVDESLQRYAVLPARPVAPTVAPTATPAPAEQTPPPATEPAEEAPDGGSVTLGRPLFFLLCGTGLLFLSLFLATLIVYAAREKRRERRALARMKERENPLPLDE